MKSRAAGDGWKLTSNDIKKDEQHDATSNGNKSVVKKFFESIENSDLGAFDEIVTDDYAHRIPDVPAGRKGLKAFFAMLLMAVPDLSMPIADMVEEGDRIAVRGRVLGTLQLDFGPFKGRGQQIDLPCIHFYVVRNGKLAEHWEATDFTSLKVA